MATIHFTTGDKLAIIIDRSSLESLESLLAVIKGWTVDIHCVDETTFMTEVKDVLFDAEEDDDVRVTLTDPDGAHPVPAGRESMPAETIAYIEV